VGLGLAARRVLRGAGGTSLGAGGEFLGTRATTSLLGALTYIE
jgi:hypothetical protein